MAYQRKTKDVICRKCGKPNRVPIEGSLTHLCCARRRPDGFTCLGDFKLDKSKS